MAPLIAPSILSADFACLGAEVAAITSAGADWVHVDVMDGHFVPNITIGPSVIAALRPHSHLPFDVHLMIAPVDPMLEAFSAAGADIITIHPEAGPHTHRSLQRIRALGKRAGLALNPGTPPHVVAELVDVIDLVLVMTVNPGFGGQSFIEHQLEKIRTVRTILDQHSSSALIEVDGGVTPPIARACVAAGATALVAGTSVFKGGPVHYANNIAPLKGS